MRIENWGTCVSCRTIRDGLFLLSRGLRCRRSFGGCGRRSGIISSAGWWRARRGVRGLNAGLRAVRKTAQNSSLPPRVEPPPAKTSGGASGCDGAAGDGSSGDESGCGAADEGSDGTTSKLTKRKRGGQPGHPQHARTWLAVEQCAEVVWLTPQTCRGCGAKWRGDDPDRCDIRCGSCRNRSRWAPSISVPVGRVPPVVSRRVRSFPRAFPHTRRGRGGSP